MDKTPPIIQCPTLETLVCQGILLVVSSLKIESYPSIVDSVIISDNCDLDFTVLQYPAISKQIKASGAYHIYVNVSDSSGNIGNNECYQYLYTASCITTFNVINKPVEVVCKEDEITLQVNDQCQAEIPQIMPNYTAYCHSNVTIEQSLETSVTIGKFDVDITVTDYNENEVRLPKKK